MPLTATEVKQAKPREKPYKPADGGGLYLLVNPKGARYWRYKYRYGCKEKTLALGVYPEISLKEAREKHAHQNLYLPTFEPPRKTKR